DNDQRTSFATESGLWRFNFSQQAGFTRLTGNATDRAWSRDRSLWNTSSKAQPPADRPREGARKIDFAFHGGGLEQLGDMTLRMLSAPTIGDVPPSPHTNPAEAHGKTTCRTGIASCSDSEEQGLSPLRLIDHSTSSCLSMNYPWIITDAATCLLEVLISQSQQDVLKLTTPMMTLFDPNHFQPRSVAKWSSRSKCTENLLDPLKASSCSVRLNEPTGASAAGADVGSLPLAQLHTARLASISAALVLLPRIWDEQFQALLGIFVPPWNLDPGHGCTKAPAPTQPAQLQPLHQQNNHQQQHQHQLQQHQHQQQVKGGWAVPDAVNLITQSRVCTSPTMSWGRGSDALSPLSPASLALAAGATVGTPVSSPPAASQTSVGLLYGVDHTNPCCASSRSDTLNRSQAAGMQERSMFIAAGGSHRQLPAGPAPLQRKALEPAAPVGQAQQQGAYREAGALTREEAEKAQGEVERPKAFNNPIRYCKLLFAGAMSAVVSRTCVAPLERVKMDLLLKNGTGDAFTTAAQVMRTEGIGGFWKGNALNVLRTAPFKAVNFFSFDIYHTAFMALSGRDANVERFLAGACAGVTATLICFPLDVVRTRLMASVVGPRYGSGPFSTLSGILRNEGAAALYSGCLPAVIGMAPAGAVFYGVYDLLKHRHLERLAADSGGDGTDSAAAARTAMDAAKPSATQQGRTLDPMYTLLYGAMAGAASELIVYPLEVIRRKMQLQSMALANMRHIGSLHPHHHHGPLFGASSGAASSAAAAAAGGRLAAAAHHHQHHMLPYHLGAQKMIATLSAAAVANSPGLARVAAAVTAILSMDGPRGFYSGLLPNMLQVLPSAALSYYTYDTLKTVLGAR
ncbi:hypothetical protein VaNZ11_015175, partial [Volvox africanus]